MLYEDSKYHGVLSAKYFAAASRPWLPVPPDPPPPPMDESVRSITVDPDDYADPYDPDFDAGARRGPLLEFARRETVAAFVASVLLFTAASHFLRRLGESVWRRGSPRSPTRT